MKTSIPRNHFALSVLLGKVRERYGRSLSAVADYASLSEEILAKTGEQLNVDTLRRLFGVRHDSYPTCRVSTLDILARFATGFTWENFVEQYIAEQGVESETHVFSKVLRATELPIGKEIALRWLPDRSCLLKYLGKTKWQVLEVQNSHTLQVGDTFSCGQIYEGEVLLADNLTRGEEVLSGVRIGLSHGVQFVDG